MDYGSGGLFIILALLLMILLPVLLDPESYDYGGAYQFDTKTTLEHERSAIQSESLIWMNQDQ
tara:strand:+ start:1785 stop:1973 length:189 start_codon:yes stop_codon:yes gene_type:complete